MTTRLSWSFSLAFQPFALPTVEASLELVEEEPAPVLVIDMPEPDENA